MSNTTSWDIPNNRYDLGQLNGKFVVTDRQRAGLSALTDQGVPADNTNPAHAKFFGMDYDTASRVAADLNAAHDARKSR